MGVYEMPFSERAKRKQQIEWNPGLGLFVI